MARKFLPSIEFVRQILDYDFEKGKLFWRFRGPELFADGKRTAQQKANIWNPANAGNEAFTSDDGNGYRHGSILNTKFHAHKVCWAIYHGVWHQGDIDHINRDRADNRILNLRAVTRSINMMNSRGKINNKSGHNGVRWVPEIRKWEARMMINYRTIILGKFDNKDDAIKARILGEKNTGFTSSHGDLSYREIQEDWMFPDKDDIEGFGGHMDALGGLGLIPIKGD